MWYSHKINLFFNRHRQFSKAHRDYVILLIGASDQETLGVAHIKAGHDSASPTTGLVVFLAGSPLLAVDHLLFC